MGAGGEKPPSTNRAYIQEEKVLLEIALIIESQLETELDHIFKDKTDIAHWFTIFLMLTVPS
ncbi:hypothetical protein CLV36_10895 [Laceyella sediminis]|uniref:Uncharacterized protein n=1 Tax=Laceyella sediminis TaxID=573074 RepID=A0ABX5EQD2_9BACL|nr:hypothetical protein CLV36_10895 [Laceyella sediminis]